MHRSLRTVASALAARLPASASVCGVGAAAVARRALHVRCAVMAAAGAQKLHPTEDKSLPQIKSSQLTVELTKNPKPKQAKETLKFGATMTDHMLEIDWTAEKGWAAPRIVPYQPLKLDPAASALHYGLECFEGMKAYVDDADQIRLFRPDMNMKRINSSAHRLLLPQVDGAEFIKCIEELVRVDKSWIPRGFGYSLYLRPTLIATWPYLGVQPALSAKLYCICSPVGPYYAEGFNPIKLLADPQVARAWPGGTGNTKVGGNYALGIRPAMEATARGYAQLLWLFGEDHWVTEVGTMNQFFFWVNEQGKKELITAPLDGTILPGVTRDSILALCRSWGEFNVVERAYTLKEVIKAVDSGRMIEAFGAGTAAIVAPVKGFHFNGKEYDIPLDASNPAAKAGKLTQRLSDTIMGIQYGKIPHEWSVVVKENKKKQ